LAEIDLAARIKELEELGKTKQEWELIKAGIDASRVNSIGYKEAMTEALAVVRDVESAWAGIESKTVTLTTIQQTITEGSPSPANLTGTGPGPGTTPDPAAEAAAITEASRDAAMAARGAASQAASAGNTSSNPITTGVMPGMSVSGTKSIVVPVGKFVRMPAGLYISGITDNGSSAKINYGNTPNQNPLDGGKPKKITGGTVKLERGLDGKLTPWQRFNAGGMAMGSDTIPAMLTPGEFVVRRPMVNKYGKDLLNQINSGSFLSGGFSSGERARNVQAPRFSNISPSVSISSNAVGPTETKTLSNSSVYNYNLSVNVASQSDPNAIAQTVMSQIRSIDSQRIRGSRF
jgi:hypothetical protein